MPLGDEVPDRQVVWGFGEVLQQLANLLRTSFA